MLGNPVKLNSFDSNIFTELANTMKISRRGSYITIFLHIVAIQ